MEKFLILIMGPQGSGKGTQGKLLAKKLGFVYSEMGPTLTEYAKTSLEDGAIIKENQQKGLLVPDEVVMRAVKYKFQGSTSIIFDGVPRNENQAEEITTLAKDYDFQMIAVYIDLSDEEATKRLLARKICPVDGYEPPYPVSLKKSTCKKCGAKLITRGDDTKEIIKKRLQEYHRATEPMIEYLAKNKIKVIKIDGRPSIDRVQQAVSSKLKDSGVKATDA